MKRLRKEGPTTKIVMQKKKVEKNVIKKTPSRA